MSKKPRPVFVALNLLIAVGCFVAGAMGYRDHVAYPEPISMSLADYLRDPPTNRRVELTDCTILYSQGVAYRQKLGGNLLDVCVPVYPAGVFSGQVPLVLQVDEQEVSSTRDWPDVTHATIAGMVSAGAGLDGKLKAVARWQPADQCVALHQNRTPSIGWAIGPCIVGLILLASGIHGIIVLRRQSGDVTEPGESLVVSFPDPMTTLTQYRNTARKRTG